MHAQIGDRVVIHGRAVGSPNRTGEVIGTKGSEETPLLVVRYDDGHETILLPSTDCEILHAE